MCMNYVSIKVLKKWQSFRYLNHQPSHSPTWQIVPILCSFLRCVQIFFICRNKIFFEPPKLWHPGLSTEPHSRRGARGGRWGLPAWRGVMGTGGSASPGRRGLPIPIARLHSGDTTSIEPTDRGDSASKSVEGQVDIKESVNTPWSIVDSALSFILADCSGLFNNRHVVFLCPVQMQRWRHHGLALSGSQYIYFAMGFFPFAAKSIKIYFWNKMLS